MRLRLLALPVALALTGLFSVPAAASTSPTCLDFVSQAEAEAYFDENAGAAVLDGDGDGIACEALPSVPVGTAAGLTVNSGQWEATAGTSVSLGVMGTLLMAAGTVLLWRLRSRDMSLPTEELQAAAVNAGDQSSRPAA